jgi:hypothetical protein
MRLHEVDILRFTVYKTDQLEFNTNKMLRPVTHYIAQLMLQALFQGHDHGSLPFFVRSNSVHFLI